MFSATDMCGTQAFLQRLLRQAEHLEAVEIVARRLEILVAGSAPAPSLIGRWPASASTSSLWPLPETPAMPTISPAWTLRSTPLTASRPSSFSAKRPATSSATPFLGAAARARGRPDDGVADHHRRHLAGGDGPDLAAADAGAAPQHREIVAEGHDLAELVADHQHGDVAALGHLAQQAEHLVGLAGRQHRGRLVEDEKALVEVELLEDLELLLLAGREPRDRPVERNLERHAVEEGVERLALLAPVDEAGASARLTTRFSAAVSAGTRVKCW